MYHRMVIWQLALLFCVFTQGHGGDSVSIPPDFASEVRPILSRHCLPCHGPDQQTRRGSLRLDLESEALEVITPGNSKESLLGQRITTDDPDDQMPPPDFHESLDEREKGILLAWIDAGAPWKEHWSFSAPARVAPPLERLNPIDAFIDAAIEEQGLSTSALAAPEILARRAALDLTGLPPDPKELDRFLKDHSKDSQGAWNRWIDHLLSLPTYGERWASPWLDLARYADTKGYEQDGHRHIWPWRDWVIRALNEDMPFDRFTLEQIAGDLLTDADTETRIATAFHRNTLTNDEGGTQDEEFRVAAVVDRVNTTMQVWMGLTASCAQCHDHKYDPLSQVEYYQLYDIFNQTEDADRNDEFPTLPYLSVPDQQELDSAKTVLQELEEQYRNQPLPEVDRTALPLTALWRDLVWSGYTLPLATETIDDRVTPWIWTALEEVAPPGISHVIHQIAPDQQTRQVYFDRSLHPVTVAEGDVFAIHVRIRKAPNTLMLQVHAADASAWEHRAYWGDDRIPWGQPGTSSRWPMTPEIDPLQNPEWQVLQIPASTVGMRPGSRLNGLALTQIGGEIEWGGVRLIRKIPPAAHPEILFPDFLAAATEFDQDLLPAEIRSSIESARDENAEAKTRVQEWWKREISIFGRRALFPARSAIAHQREEITRIERRALPLPILQPLAAERERATHLLQRGSYLQPGQAVSAAAPAFLPPLADSSEPDRLRFARWLIDPKNPLTARVQVNRIWEQVFGLGLVPTIEDLGTQGDLPSHGKLLDYLAVTWQKDDGWSMKKLLRRILTSETYRRSSRVDETQQSLDPQNRWLARSSRVRLPAETIRDQALAIGGLLSPKMHGPPVYPPQPDGVWQVVYNGSQWPTSSGEDRVRRSIYTYWRRTAPYPAMLIFDSPDRQVCHSRRIRTNTPLQALVTLNDPVYLEAAGGLAHRSLIQHDDSKEALRLAFRLATCRFPDAEEFATLQRYLEEEQSRFLENPEQATLLLESVRWPQASPTDIAGKAALVMVANVILNLDEVLVRR